MSIFIRFHTIIFTIFKLKEKFIYYFVYNIIQMTKEIKYLDLNVRFNGKMLRSFYELGLPLKFSYFCKLAVAKEIAILKKQIRGVNDDSEQNRRC